jgi:AcrR family transcriptional regulator
MDGRSSSFGSARTRAHEDIVREIKSTAWRLLAEEGQVGLSLRAVARELGVASSALYRYFPSREHLLQALAAEAQAALSQRLGPPLRRADAGPRARWHACCRAARDWARAHPHQFALLDARPLPPAVPGLPGPLAASAGGPRALLAWTLLLGLLRFDLLTCADEALFGLGADALAALWFPAEPADGPAPAADPAG